MSVEINFNDLIKIVATGAVSAIVAYGVNFWGFNSKRKEIKLQNFHKDRIEAIKTLYSLIVDLQLITINLFETDRRQRTHDDYKKELLSWLTDYSKVSGHYSRNRILLLESNEKSEKIRADLNGLRPIRNEVIRLYDELIDTELVFGGDITLHYNNEDNEYYMIKELIIKAGVKKEMTDLIKHFDTIRISLEDYFKTIAVN